MRREKSDETLGMRGAEPHGDDQQRRIHLIGGSVRAAAEDARRSGYEIVAMDHFGDADLLAACDRWIHLPRTDAWPGLLADPHSTVVPTGGFDWPQTASPPHAGLIAFPSKDAFDEMRSPKVLAELANRSGIRFPVTIEASDVASFMNGNSYSDKSYSWLIKPYAGTGGLGIRSPLPPETSPIEDQVRSGEYLQQRITGRPIGVNFISRFRSGRYETRMLGIFAGLTHRKNADHRWLYGGSIGPLPWSVLHRENGPHESNVSNLITLGNNIAERFQLVGLFNVDLMLASDQSLSLLEINPRYSASMELLPAAGSLIDCHLAAYQSQAGVITEQQADQRFAKLGPVGDPISYNKDFGVACKRILYATKPARFDRSVSQINDSVRDLVEPLSLEVTFHDLPASSDTIPSGYPVMTIIARLPVSKSIPQPSEILSNTPVMLRQLIRQTYRIAARLRKTLELLT